MNMVLTQEQTAYLHKRGFNLVTVIDIATLPSDVTKALVSAGASVGAGMRLLMLANAGPSLWRAMRRERATTGSNPADPVDEYSERAAGVFIGRYLADYNNQLLYPTTMPIPLTALGEFCGWSAPSRLGIGINADYGLWFAYRAVVLTDAPLPVAPGALAADVCATCENQRCISACPADAVSEDSPFNLEVCANKRLQPDSECALTCAARTACPVASESQYGHAQLAHHMERSLPALRIWSANRTR